MKRYSFEKMLRQCILNSILVVTFTNIFPNLNQVTFDYIKTLVAEEEAAAAQGQQNRQPKEKNEPDSSSAAASGATVDADRHDLCDEVCDDDLEKYRDARLEEML